MVTSRKLNRAYIFLLKGDVVFLGGKFKTKRYPDIGCVKHRFKVECTDRVWEYQGFNLGGKEYHILSCINSGCEARVFVDKAMWQPKFIGKTVKIEGNNV